MKRSIIFIVMIFVLGTACSLGISAQDEKGIRIECSDPVSSDRSFELDIFFWDDQPVKGGSAEFYYDEEHLEVMSVNLMERDTTESFKYNDKGGSIVFNFNCFTSRQNSRAVRIKLRPLEKYEKQECEFRVENGSICTDSSDIVYQDVSSAKITLMKKIPKDGSEQGDEDTSSKESNNKSDHDISGNSAKIIYIQEKGGSSNVMQTAFLSVLGIGAVAAALVVILRIVRNKSK